MLIVFYYNTWNDDQIHVRFEDVANDCDFLEIHEALSAYLALKGVSVHESAFEEAPSVITGSIDDMIERGKKLIREQND